MQIASLRVPIREYFREKSDMWQDLRYAARIFWKKPGFAIAAILPLAFGVGATTALFSVVYAVLLDPLPYTEPDRIIDNFFIDKTGAPRGMFLTTQQLMDLQKSDVIEDAIALDIWAMTLTGDDLPESVSTNYYSANGANFLGLTPVVGRVFTAADGPPNEEPSHVVVLTHSFWQSHFGGRADAVGQTIQLNREPYTIIGVVSPGFDSYLGDIVVPIHLKLDPTFAWATQARLKRGITKEIAEARLTGLLERFKKEAPVRFSSELRVKLSTLVDQRRTSAVLPTLISLFAATRCFSSSHAQCFNSAVGKRNAAPTRIGCSIFHWRKPATAARSVVDRIINAGGDRVVRGNRPGLLGRAFCSSLAFYERIREQIAATPEVISVGIGVYTGSPPRFGERFPLEIPGDALTERDFTRVVRSSPEYLATLRIPLMLGRMWSPAETARAAHVAVLNEAMARRFWPSEDPIGKRIRVPAFAKTTSQFVVAAPGSDGWFEIIGVVRDVPNSGLRALRPIDVYPLYIDARRFSDLGDQDAA